MCVWVGASLHVCVKFELSQTHVSVQLNVGTKRTQPTLFKFL